MLVSFSSPEAVAEAFHTGMAISAMAVIAMTTFLVLVLRGEPFHLGVKSAVSFSTIAFAGLGAFTYSSTYGCFVGAEVSESGIRLEYVGPLGGEVFLPRETIEMVLFGLPGKSPGRCYIRVQPKSGKSYRSATRFMPAEACKGMRAQMQTILDAPSSVQPGAQADAHRRLTAIKKDLKITVQPVTA